jgi:hypothetical protein
VECDVVKNYGFVVSNSSIKIVIWYLQLGVQYMWWYPKYSGLTL